MRDHPAFPVLHGVFHDREHFYLAMTFGGRSFTSVQVATRQRGLRLGAQLVLAVHALHKRGVVHSDIKHGNLLLGHNNRITLIDFGLSHIFDMASPTLEEWPAWNALKEAGTDAFPMLWADEPNPHVCLAMGGTPGYMSPLVRWQEEVSYGADLWAVGVILHHWLTGSVGS
ncbi:kinase-like domain-containing protein [Mycena crocata]|nr:kinase-like domain-containing protein [Mycena crocata]